MVSLTTDLEYYHRKFFFPRSFFILKFHWILAKQDRPGDPNGTGEDRTSPIIGEFLNQRKFMSNVPTISLISDKKN